jgi:hypothetical protein
MDTLKVDACVCGKGDEAPAIVHAEDCSCADWVYGALEGRDKSKGGKMAEDSVFEFTEEKEIREGGEELTPDEAAAEQKAKDPDTLATPTELLGGGTSGGPNVHSGTPSEL